MTVTGALHLMCGILTTHIFIYQANIHFKFKIVDLSNFKYFYKNDHSFFIFFSQANFSLSVLSADEIVINHSFENK